MEVITNDDHNTIYFPSGAKYVGCWRHNKQEDWGKQTAPDKIEEKFHFKKDFVGPLIYVGNWKCGQRHGLGQMLRQKQGELSLIYAGEWEFDRKCGEGKKIYEDGTIYFGNWMRSRRHGLGIQWYKNGNIYMGEWQANLRHGLGVLFYANGNQYEGYFARGYKNGEGVFYHNHSGQIQKGIWYYDDAKVSIIQDEKRNMVDKPTPYPIPINYLHDPNEFINILFNRYLSHRVKSRCTFSEHFCRAVCHMMRHHASFESRIDSPSKLDLYEEFDIPCACKKPEKLISLASNV